MKKAHQVRSNVKVLFTVFFDCIGVVHHEFLPQGRMVNKESYLEVMRRLLEAICQKRIKLCKNPSWILHSDNTSAYTSMLVLEFLAKNEIVISRRVLDPGFEPQARQQNKNCETFSKNNVAWTSLRRC